MSEEKKETTTKKVVEPRVIKNALIVDQQLAQRIMAIFDEMPRRYSGLIDPVQAEFARCPIADVTLNDKEK